MLNIAVLAPTPSASASTATAVTPGVFRIARTPNRTSCSRAPMVLPGLVDVAGACQVPVAAQMSGFMWSRGRVD